MSQRKVSDFLMKNKGKGYTIKELSKELSLCYGSVYNNCKRLVRSGFIKYYNRGTKSGGTLYYIENKR